MITLLIRCSYRPDGFARTLASIPEGTLIICSYDDVRALNYIPGYVPRIPVYKSDRPFFYDDYCNDLKQMVDNGYFGFIDEGDVILPGALDALRVVLKGSHGVICQFSRGGKLKPPLHHLVRRQIVRGKIGMPCLFLHHSHKNVADFDGSVGAADYHWIKAVARKIKLKFINIPVVYAEKRDKGATEG